MLVARDGDDDTLFEHEGWVRAVVDRALSKPVNGHDRPTRIDYHDPALAASALIHLWRRRAKIEDRNRLIELTLRADRCSVPAFAVNIEVILATDERVLKSAVRVAFATSRYRWAPWDENPELKSVYERGKEEDDIRAVAAEVAWLNGGIEPIWPALPAERPLLKRSGRIRLPAADEEDEEDVPVPPLKDSAIVRAETHSLANWLSMLTQKPGSGVAWRAEIVEAYSPWSASFNGLGLPADAELGQRRDDWNNAFYLLLAPLILDMTQDRFQAEVIPITQLPDDAFCDVVEPLLRAADATYFNQAERSPDRIVELRQILTRRAMEIEDLDWAEASADMSVGISNSGMLATLLFNEQIFGRGLQSYLVPAVADRLDPLLVPMLALMSGGPTSFLAIGTMNTLLVAPRARHLDFLLSSVEAWLERTGDDSKIWLDFGIGTKVTDWFEKIGEDNPGIFESKHPQRARIDAVFGRLVDLGVPQAHELLQSVGR